MIALGLLLVLGAPANAAGRPIAIDEAFKLSLVVSEQLAQRSEGIEELRERTKELWSNVLPRASFLGTDIIQDQPPPSESLSSFTQRYRPQIGFTAHQPLFSGFREFLALKAGHAQEESASLDLLRAKQLIYQDVVRAYLDLLGVHDQIAIQRALVDITEARIKELKSFEQIGRSRRSEVLSAESQLAQTEASLATYAASERVFQARLKFLTGLTDDLEPQVISLPSTESIDSYLSRLNDRADVAARRRDRDVNALFVRIQSRQRWPSIYADGNYYLKRPSGFLEHIKWDATLTVSMPLFTGGQIGAQVGQAAARLRSSEQALKLAVRNADTEVRSFFDELQFEVAVVRALDKASNLAAANAKAQTADYRHGLVTNLDVLSALNSEQDARLKLDQAQLQAFWTKTRLEVAAGGPKEVR